MNWIDVNEGLPEYYLKVLFLFEEKCGRQVIYMGYHCKEGWDIYLPYRSFGLNESLDIGKVTHWMTLPEYPTKKESIEKMSNDSLEQKIIDVLLDNQSLSGRIKILEEQQEIMHNFLVEINKYLVKLSEKKNDL